MINTHKPSILGITSFLLSLAGFTVLPVIGSLAGILVGNLALSTAAVSQPANRDGFARAGIYLGWIALILAGTCLLVAAISAAPFLR